MTQKKAESSQPVPHSEHQLSGKFAWAWSVAAAGNALEALALIALAVVALYGIFSGGASTTTRAITEAVSLLILGAGVALLALNLVRRKSLAKTPTLLWNGILFLLSFSVIKGGAPWAGIATLVVSVVTFIAAAVLPRFDLDDQVL